MKNYFSVLTLLFLSANAFSASRAHDELKNKFNKASKPAVVGDFDLQGEASELKCVYVIDDDQDETFHRLIFARVKKTYAREDGGPLFPPYTEERLFYSTPSNAKTAFDPIQFGHFVNHSDESENSFNIVSDFSPLTRETEAVYIKTETVYIKKDPEDPSKLFFRVNAPGYKMDYYGYCYR